MCRSVNEVPENIKWPFVIRQSLVVKGLLTFFAAAAILSWYDQTAQWQTMAIAGVLVFASANAFFYRVEITSQVIRKRSLFGIRTVPLSRIASHLP